MKKLLRRDLSTALLISSMALSSVGVMASDHDDGESDVKNRSTNLTDVYAFREDKEITTAASGSPTGGSAAHVIFIVNSYPRAIPRVQYYFSSTAVYDLHIGRVGTGAAADKDLPAKKTEDIILRVQFGAPDNTGKQAMTVTTIVDGAATSFVNNNAGSAISTTPLSAGATPVVNEITANGQTLQVFAGLRKDPFFFDVNAFFQFRIAAAGSTSGGTVFAAPAGYSSLGTGVYTPDGQTAQDFTSGYNANSIAFRIPIAYLQSAGQKVFDTWATVSIPQ